jgi:hypothetical protein
LEKIKAKKARDLAKDAHAKEEARLEMEQELHQLKMDRKKEKEAAAA